MVINIHFKILGLDDLKLDRHWCIIACSAVTGEGLKEGIHWIVSELAGSDFNNSINNEL